MQEEGLDTVEANVHLGFEPDERDYGLVAALLHKKQVHDVTLMTNNPDKMTQLEALGITLDDRLPIETPVQPESRHYLETKKHKMHHLLKEVQ